METHLQEGRVASGEAGGRVGKLWQWLVLLPFFTAYALALVFATWDRLEMMVPAQLMMGLALIVLVALVWKRRSIVFGYFDAWLCLGALYFIMRALFSPVAYYGNVDAGIIAMGISCWLLARNVWATNTKYPWVLLAIVMVAAHMAAAYYQYSGNMQWGLLRHRSSQASISISGLYGHYNYLANYLAMIACGMLGFVFHGKHGKVFRVCVVLLIAAAVAGLIWTKSRGGLVALGAGCFSYMLAVVFLTTVKKNKGRWKVVAAVLLGACILVGALVAAASNFAVRRGYADGAGFLHDNGRKNNSIMAVDQIVNGPLVGSGARSYEWMSHQYWLDDIWGKAPIPNYVHNEYLQSMTDYGPIGGLFVFVTLLAAIALSWRTLLTERDLSDTVAYNLAGMAACAAFLVQCFFSFPAHVLANTLTFVLVLSFAIYRSSTVARHRSLAGLAGFSLLALGLVGFLVYAAVMGAPTFLDRFEQVAYQRSTPEIKRQMLDTRLAKVTKLTEWRADFKNLRRKGELHWAKAMVAEDEELQRAQLAQAADAYQSASEKYPWEPSLHVNAGLALDRLYRFDEAEQHFLAAFKYGERADYWIKSKWNLANHYYLRGRYLWLKRKPEKGLGYLLLADDLLDDEKKVSFRGLKNQIRENIEFLENAGISVDPAEQEAVPSR
ncbi:O-antigen ligase family protein [Verrucomicrobiaceae bacterium R5-34]|nr:O-antigen ligase family protein [Verrucomicrobiaceae bacterium R5-34]